MSMSQGERVRNYYRNQGAEQREQEIIARLEREATWLESTGFEENETEANGIRAAIGLIKGEEK